MFFIVADCWFNKTHMREVPSAAEESESRVTRRYEDRLQPKGCINIIEVLRCQCTFLRGNCDSIGAEK
jgi:hypothetical protein